jgi:hypothetical protein
LNQLLLNLKRVPRNARTLLSIIVKRVTAINENAGEVMLPIFELQAVCNMRSDELAGLVQILERHDIVSVWPEESSNPNVELRRLKSGWPIWNDLAKFCCKTGTPVEALVVELEFNRLD